MENNDQYSGGHTWLNKPANRLPARPTPANSDLNAPTAFTTSSQSPTKSQKESFAFDEDLDRDNSIDELDLLSSPTRRGEEDIAPQAETSNKIPEMLSQAFFEKHKLSFKKKGAGGGSGSGKRERSTATTSTATTASKPSTISPKKSQSSLPPTEPTKRRSAASRHASPPPPLPHRRAANKPHSTIDLTGDARSRADKVYDDSPKPDRPRPKPKRIEKKVENKHPTPPSSSHFSPRRNTPVVDLDSDSSSPTKRSTTGKSKAVTRDLGGLSPLQNTSNDAPKRRAAKAFPMSNQLPSPSSSQSDSAGKGKGKSTKSSSQAVKGNIGLRVESSEEPSDAEPPKPAPFPLALSPIATARRLAPFPLEKSPSFTPRPQKRVLSNPDGPSSRKKRKDDSSVLPSQIPNLDSDDDAMFLDPTVDPKTLCPYCDEPLPPKPTSLLRELLKTMRTKSRSQPRATNPLGRKAPVHAFIALCQRHRFESKILPEAERNGWPKEIEFDKLEKRVRKMKLDLKVLIQDDEVRRNNVFWKEVMADVKAKGSKAMAGVRNQFANFDKMQPGYYGEQGSVIIQHTLFDMFPPAAMNLDAIKPLTANEFMQRILVPEVAKHLIKDDQNISSDEKAIKILRESTSYGVAMFPEDGGEWGESKHKDQEDKLGVADMMVMERARKRRKELEIEEMEEEEKKRQMLETKGRPKPKPLGKRSTIDDLAAAPPSDDLLDIDEHDLGSDEGDADPWKKTMYDSDRRQPSSEADDDNFFSNLDKKSPVKKNRDLEHRSSSMDLPSDPEEGFFTKLNRESPAKKRRKGGEHRSSSMDLETTEAEEAPPPPPKRRSRPKHRDSDSDSDVVVTDVVVSSPPQSKPKSIDVDATPRPTKPKRTASSTSAKIETRQLNPLAKARSLGGVRSEKSDFEWLLGPGA